MNLGTRKMGTGLNLTWPYMIDMLIRSFITDVVLQSAYNKETMAKQKDEEDKTRFSKRILDVSSVCLNVFTLVEFVNHYLRGLRKATHERVREVLNSWSPDERFNITAARQLAHLEGRTQSVQDQDRCSFS